MQLPPSFPDALPGVYVADLKSLDRRIPHLEKNGKVCIAPESGVLLDVARPREIVKQAIVEARKIIATGLADPTAELQREFLAYWDPIEKLNFRWVSPPPDNEGALALLHVLDKDSSRFYEHLIAPTEEDGKEWAARADKLVKNVGKAYFIPLAKPLQPPRINEQWTVKGFFAILEAQGVDVSNAMEWLTSLQPPADIFLSIPGPSGKIVVGVRLDAAGNGPRSANAALYFSDHPDAIASRTEVQRVDSGFLLPRAGGTPSLATKTVVLVGCGAVGSQVAKILTLLGVGTLHMIDFELLKAENIHRHLLGLRFVGFNKALTLAATLGRDYPHAKFFAYEKSALEVFAANPALFTSADAIMLATGDETLERRLNSLLIGGPPRIHAWVEPLGLGGHALAVGLGHTGCLDCLYEEADGTGLHNSAAFVRPGQKLRKSLSGCAGDFLPFSALDALRTATEAGELVGRVLTGQAMKSTIISWHGDSAPAQKEKIQLSERVRKFAPGSKKQLEDVRRLACPTCSSA